MNARQFWTVWHFPTNAYYGAVTADRAVKGILITTSDFTVQAREFGQKVGLELIGGKELQNLMLEHKIDSALLS